MNTKETTMPQPNSAATPPPPMSSMLVTGDVVQDIYIYRGDRDFPEQPGKIAPYHSTRPGGAWGLWELLNQVRSGDVHWGLRDPVPNDPLQSVHVLWTACEGGTKKEHDDAPKGKKPDQVWRVGQSLGYTLGAAKPGVLPKSPAANERHGVVVIDDAGLGFRTVPNNASWPQGILRSEPQPDWIIHKLANPIAQGDLWHALVGGGDRLRRDNLIVIVSADQLRRAGAAISRGFSWERTLSELCNELNHNPVFQPLLRFPRRLVVNFGCVGAIWFGESCNPASPDAPAQDRARLVYDPTLPEGGWKSLLMDEHGVYGHLNTFTAAIALTATATPVGAVPDLDAAIQRGLTACRLLRLLGHGKVTAAKPGPPLADLALLLSPNPAEPKVREEIETVQKRLFPQGLQTIAGSCGRLHADVAETWTLTAVAENPAAQPQLPLYGLAHRVALYGIGEVAHIPHAHFGVLLSVDRQEIETLRSLTQLIQNYEREKLPKQPLSIAAFGPPGAGKSFGIKQIAHQVLGKDIPFENFPILEFNLSQFDDAAELFGAFHQVRDKALKGVTPVVFWDEFDARDYKWLQYLLAPMQDGTFEEHGHTHAIGKCLFIFAGATSWDFQHFGPAPMPDGWQAAHDAKGVPAKLTPEVKALAKYYADSEAKDLRQLEAAANADFRRKKGPDFLSRLDGHINVLGPNRQMQYNWATRAWDIPDANDITFPIRRALLLRQFLGAKKPGDTLAIDRDLLRAFLHVPRYRHGARSLEKIARYLALARPPFRRANLPPRQVLAQHLDSLTEFDILHHGNRKFLTAENLRRIAAAIDENYSRLVDAAEARKAAKNNTPYQPRTPLTEAQFIAEFRQKEANPDAWAQWLVATNIAAAQRLPDVLALVGLRLEEGLANAAETQAVEEHLNKHLTPLAKEEHTLWMQFHLENGWRQADDDLLKQLAALKKQDNEAYKKELKRLKKEERIHTLLVPFNKLPVEEIPKDYDAILHYPETVALVGWKIAFCGE